MQQYKQDFIEFVVKAGALKFGSFTLKSGRQAPWFFNAGSFDTGEKLAKLGEYYAAAALESGVDFDVLFGPAYKGIPLAVATVIALQHKGKNYGYAFNRKEKKEYGMKDPIIGAKLSEGTRVILIDDVITAGTAIRESVEIFKENGNPNLAGILISINRQEKNNDGINAIQAVEEELGCPVIAIATFAEIIEHLHGREVDGKVVIDDEQMKIIERYRAEYGV
ncbi:orotate phosphoribosyltransferase [Candidatus Peregrinibacteria bacterium CG11_big_fil_rev_8_21_14_0_20_46_8]|nr:MAG: orotate phosphoribosyltransferase [Candidatus Peregrinibacteria bacterium CG11_big_fil_rev_8_21_14_0_20_46_8]